MDVSLIRSIPTPINIAEVHGYTKAVKDAKFSAMHTMAKVSRRAKDLLAECCENENLPSPVPNHLEIHEATESAAFILLKPVMEPNDYTIPVSVSGGQVRVELRKLLDIKKIRTLSGHRLVIPISSVTIQGWGSGLVLHMGALDWVPIKKRGEATVEQEKS